MSTGDFNGDGLGDLAPACFDDSSAYAWISLARLIRQQHRLPNAPRTIEPAGRIRQHYRTAPGLDRRSDTVYHR